MGQTSAAQLDWEDQHGRKSVNKPIPEDLKTQYEYASSNQRLNIGTYSDMYVRELIVRIGRVEQERDSLVEMQKNLDDEVAQLIKERNQLRATRIEDGLKIAKLEQENTKLKLFSDAACDLLGTPEHKIGELRRIIEENAKLKARTLSCVFCGGPAASVEELKMHSADCPNHPAVIERDRLKRAVNWAMGSGPDDFPERQPGQGAYWWRIELSKRADLAGKEEEYHA